MSTDEDDDVHNGEVDDDMVKGDATDEAETDGFLDDLGQLTDEEGTGIQEIALVKCDTTAGPFTINLIKSWSPNGYERAVTLFERSFYDDSHFFRVIPKFLVQFGIGYTDDKILQRFASSTIKDDPVFEPKISFEEGVVSFAGSGPNSRTSHLFVAYGPSNSLGTMPWETPIGEVVDGMANLRKLYSGYGDGKPHGNGPEQYKIRDGGKSFMNENYPNLDSFLTCKTSRKRLNNGKILKEEDTEVKVTEEARVMTAEIPMTGKKALRHRAKRFVESAEHGIRMKREEGTLNGTISTGTIIIIIVVGIIYVLKSRGKKLVGKNS